MISPIMLESDSCQESVGDHDIRVRSIPDVATIIATGCTHLHILENFNSEQELCLLSHFLYSILL